MDNFFFALDNFFFAWTIIFLCKKIIVQGKKKIVLMKLLRKTKIFVQLSYVEKARTNEKMLKFC